MLKANRTYFVLLSIFAFAFLYRLSLMLWNYFPPGADIGLHNSVIYSITGHGNTNFMYNFFQMGGGTSLTFPGYHIFASSVMMITGLPEYWAQASIVALFSSLLVLCAFLVTKRVWNESAGYVVAFLVAISRFDVEMTLWGGYPNVITLLLIPLTFYLFLQRDRFSKVPFLVSTSILAGSIFLTHSLSAGIFVCVTSLTVLLILISPQSFGSTRRTGLMWLLSMVLGVVLVLPFLASAVPTYLHDNSSAPGVSGVNDINSAILSTRILPLEWVLPLFLIIIGFAAFSKRYNNRVFTLPALLLSVWLFVPLFLTQGYLFGFIIDYNRFLYFVILPTIIFVAVMIEYGSKFFAESITNLRVLTKKQAKEETSNKETSVNFGVGFKSNISRSWQNQNQKTQKSLRKTVHWLSIHSTSKTMYAAFILFFLVFSFALIPLFLTPSEGLRIQSFYQTMNNPGWDAIQWIKQNTTGNSVFVSDALYGWWLGGFAQRPTLSAVDPQYLTSARELNPAKNASYLLDTDYLIDNNMVQVREDGGYLARHNPEILADLNWTYFPYSFFNFDSSQTEIKYEVNGTLHSSYLSDLQVTGMRMDKGTDYATISVSRGNDFFNYTQFTTVYGTSSFVNVTSTLDSTASGVSLDWVNVDVQSKGTQLAYDDQRTVAMVDVGVKTFGQLIFNLNQPAVSTKNASPLLLDLEYQLQSKSHGEIQILASAYSADNNPDIYKDTTSLLKYFDPVIAANLKSAPTTTNTYLKEAFDYHTMLQNYSVSYVVCRVPEMYPKFLRDPAFSLVFINSEVAIFRVNG
jgi:hypothetical protein